MGKKKKRSTQSQRNFPAMEMPARANQLNKTPHTLLTDQVISVERLIRKVWLCHSGKYKSWCTCCQLQARNKFVFLNPGCSLEAPKELIKNTNAQAPPQTNKTRILGNGSQVLVFFFLIHWVILMGSQSWEPLYSERVTQNSPILGADYWGRVN